MQNDLMLKPMILRKVSEKSEAPFAQKPSKMLEKISLVFFSGGLSFKLTVEELIFLEFLTERAPFTKHRLVPVVSNSPCFVQKNPLHKSTTNQKIYFRRSDSI